MTLPDDYTFDVPAAQRQLAALALKDPEASLILTLAQLGAGGLEAESDIRLKATEAAALLEQVGEDQRIAGKPIYVLRITEWRSETPPPPPRDDP
ncbi:hypothetical protein [Armatimonas sp.]|uniref:hypothetical protein n=1 Tax=Armatimonas sp. TaxID=1872638 RepID=UPI00286D052D|nr:hypothetical protein [Armatimonas sp.]